MVVSEGIGRVIAVQRFDNNRVTSSAETAKGDRFI